MEIRRVAVVGLGLIGGSVARDLAALGVEVVGGDIDADVFSSALASGVVARPLGERMEGVEEADLVVLAVPVDAAPAALTSVAARLAPGAAVTDVGSTKRSIAAAAARAGLADRFVGSHPLAGDHRAGWVAGRAGLFRAAPVFLCPAADAAPWAVQRVRALWTALGAEPWTMDVAEHDRLLAWSSHLPQLASTALALALDNAGVARATLGPGGRDATRLSGSSPPMWTAIALDNADELEPALRALAARIEELRAAVAAGDGAAIAAALQGGNRWAGGG